MTSRTRPARARVGLFVLALCALLAAFAVLVGVTGGVRAEIAGVDFRSRSWQRPAGLAVLLLGLGLTLARGHLLSCAVHMVRVLPLLLAAGAITIALMFGAFAAGGADSYGYLSQAALFAEGRLTLDAGLRGAFAWPESAATFTPLGYTVGRTPDVCAPIYPPGLPLLMASLAIVHPRAVFLVVPICAGLTVWLCARLGRELEEPFAGGMAAVLLACSPTFLFQSVQPMSDVPATTAWLAALVAANGAHPRSAPLAGALSAVAILIRPNLASLAVLVVAAAARTASRAWSIRRAVSCAAAIVPGVVVLCAIQYARHGSPLTSGYGPIGELFSTGNIGPNLARYPRWLVETHTPFVWLWVVAPLWIVRTARPARTFAWVCYGFAAGVVLSYLPYAYFQPSEWTYTRFLLPALPVMLLLDVILVLAALERLWRRGAVPLALLLTLALAVWLVATARSRGVFAVHQVEQKYPAVGAIVDERLPRSAVVLAKQHSGSVRYYSGRQTIRWDILDPAWLDRALSDLRQHGHQPFLVLDAAEEIEFRGRFAPRDQRALAQMTIVETVGRTRIYAFE